MNKNTSSDFAKDNKTELHFLIWTWQDNSKTTESLSNPKREGKKEKEKKEKDTKTRKSNKTKTIQGLFAIQQKREREKKKRQRAATLIILALNPLLVKKH